MLPAALRAPLCGYATVPHALRPGFPTQHCIVEHGSLVAAGCQTQQPQRATNWRSLGAQQLPAPEPQQHDWKAPAKQLRGQPATTGYAPLLVPPAQQHLVAQPRGWSPQRWRALQPALPEQTRSALQSRHVQRLQPANQPQSAIPWHCAQHVLKPDAAGQPPPPLIPVWLLGWQPSPSNGEGFAQPPQPSAATEICRILPLQPLALG
mmetsp:Transcript_54080/g.107645  ORF Transcript_54080/g.107645 Transcript_54080/m.107645 type:complete len:207 (+) Transcript_54080:951-1571(+)